MLALDGYCRTSDDRVDRPRRDPALALARWRSHMPADGAMHDDLVASARADTSRPFAIPPGLAQPLIDGAARHPDVPRGRDLVALSRYCS
jgi:phytoene/squalene synthetase